MVRPDSLESFSFASDKKKEPNFHGIFFVYVTTLNMLNFINEELVSQYSNYFDNWLQKITNKINGFTNEEKDELKKIHEFLETTDKKKSFVNGVVIELKSDNTKNVMAELDDYYEYSKNSTKLIQSIMFVHIITSFEEFLQDVLNLLYHIKPEILKSSNKKMDFEDIMKFDDISELYHALIQKQIEDLFNEGLDSINKYLTDKTGLDLSQYEKWVQIREKYARRNVIVHNHGEANKRYFEFINETPKQIDLNVDGNYLKESLKLFRDFAHFITDYYEIRLGTKQKDSEKAMHSIPSSEGNDKFVASLLKSLKI